MKNSFRKKIILAVGAHPDDIDFSASGTLAKGIKEGATVYYLICTNGNRGSDDPKMTHQKLARIRKKEQLAAAKILGVKKVFFLNYEDGQLENSLHLKEKIAKVIRKVRPNIIFTTDPTIIYSQKRGYINHPDHRACGQATLDAIYPLARDRLSFLHHEKNGLKPHKVEEVYLTNFDERDTFFDITKTMNLKIKILKAHSSQISEETLKRIKKWAALTGKEKGFKFAEGFKKIKIAF
jgi:LmbE family N-acetylglucosaminyl deacetylase